MPMLVPLKHRSGVDAVACIDKFVLSVWPQFVAGKYVTSICNVSITVRVDRRSPRPLSRLELLAESQFFAGPAELCDISTTLLDPDNPLTYTTQGLYRRRGGGLTLSFYDGLPDVMVDCNSDLVFHHEPGWPFARLEVLYAEPIRPGTSAAVRFYFAAPGVFAAASDGTLRFILPIHSDYPLRQFWSPEEIARHGLPMLNLAADGVAGGTDVFFYMPIEYEGVDFSHEPFHRLLPDYDFRGRRDQVRRIKFAWPGLALKPRPGREFEIGDNLSLHGTFRRTTVMSTHNSVGHVEGPVIFGDAPGSAISASGPATTTAPAADRDTILRAIDELRRMLDDAGAVPGVELVHHEVDALENAVRVGRFVKARRRLEPLVHAVRGLADSAAPILDVIDRLNKML